MKPLSFKFPLRVLVTVTAAFESWNSFEKLGDSRFPKDSEQALHLLLSTTALVMSLKDLIDYGGKVLTASAEVILDFTEFSSGGGGPAAMWSEDPEQRYFRNALNAKGFSKMTMV
jgi:hypothetical protein